MAVGVGEEFGGQQFGGGGEFGEAVGGEDGTEGCAGDPRCVWIVREVEGVGPGRGYGGRGSLRSLRGVGRVRMVVAHL